MEFDKINNIVTHVRCIDSKDKARSISIVIAQNSAMMETIGCRIEDPEYDLYLSSVNISVPKELNSKEVAEKAMENLDKFVQEIEEQVTEAPKRGRKPKVKENEGI